MTQERLSRMEMSAFRRPWHALCIDKWVDDIIFAPTERNFTCALLLNSAKHARRPPQDVTTAPLCSSQFLTKFSLAQMARYKTVRIIIYFKIFQLKKQRDNTSPFSECPRAEREQQHPRFLISHKTFDKGHLRNHYKHISYSDSKISKIFTIHVPGPLATRNSGSRPESFTCFLGMR